MCMEHCGAQAQAAAAGGRIPLIDNGCERVVEVVVRVRNACAAEKAFNVVGRAE